jgi:hypothetical protein
MAKSQDTKTLQTTPAPTATALKAAASAILAAPPSERAGMLMVSDDIASLVPRIPPEELLFTLRSAKGGEISEILSHARTSQLRFVLDMELWTKDEIIPERGEFWMKIFDNFEIPTLARFVKGMDHIDLAALTGKQITAALADENGHQPYDDPEGYVSFTEDGVYYYTVKEELLPMAKKFIILLLSEERSKYLHLLELYVTGFDAEDEESALQFRKARIAEHGFVDFDEAQKVYIPLTTQLLDEEPPRREGAASIFESEGYDAPRYPVAQYPHGADKLRTVLDRLADSDQAEALMAQLATLTNKVLAADALDPADTESFRSAALKVAGYLTIGLESLCGADEDAMTRALDRHWLEHIFRIGWTRVIRLSKKARFWLKEGWPQGRKERLLLLNSPLPEMLEALLMRRPKLMVEGSKIEALHDFSCLREVELGERTIEKADFLGRFIMSMVNFQLGNLTKALSNLDEENLKSRTIFLTALLNSALGRGFAFAPIARDEVMAGLDKLWDPDSEDHRIEPTLASEAIARSQEVMTMKKSEVQFLREFIDASITLLEEEFGGLPRGAEPDPRFLKGLWID